MRTEELIADLASRAEPVRPLPSPAVRAATWSSLAIACAVAGVFVFGLRRNFAAAVHRPDFIWIVLLSVVTGALAAVTSLVLAIPGAERSAAMRRSTLALVGVWALTLVAGVLLAGIGFSRALDWPVCFARVTLIGLAPAVVLFAMLRRAAPLRLAWASWLAMTAAMSSGALAIQFICPLNDSSHILLGHLGPVVVIAGLAVVFARRLLR